MRKVLAFLLAVLMLATTFLLTSCDLFESKGPNDHVMIETLPTIKDPSVGKDTVEPESDDQETSGSDETETEHVHVFDQMLVEEAFLKSAATCGAKATYYYSCLCGELGETTFEDGELLPHEFDVEWESDETHHWHKALCEHESERSEEAEHSYGFDEICDVCLYDNTKDSITFATLTADGTTVSGKVSNATETFSFADEIRKIGYAEYRISRDAQGTQALTDLTVSLEVGDNVFYVIATLNSEPVVYTVTLRRRPIYIVTFDANGGFEIEPQEVEEDGLVNAPTTQKFGYVLSGWDYDLTRPITSNTTITAIWEEDSRQTATSVGGMSAKELYDLTKELVDENRNFTLNETQTVEQYVMGQYVDTSEDTFVEKVAGDGYSLFLIQNGVTHDYRYVTYDEGDEDNVYYVYQYNAYGTLVKNKAKLTPDDFAILGDVDPEESKILGIPESALNSIGFYVEEDYYYIEYMIDGDRYKTMAAFPYDIDGDVSYRLYFNEDGDLLNITLKLKVTLLSSGYTITMDFCTVAEVSDVGTTTIEPPADADDYLDVTESVKEQVEQKKNQQNLQPQN